MNDLFFVAFFGFAMFITGAGFIPAYYILRLPSKKFGQVNWLEKYNDHFIVTYPLLQLLLWFIIFIRGKAMQVWNIYTHVNGWDQFLLVFASVWGFMTLIFLVPRFRKSVQLVLWHNLVFLLTLTAMIILMASPAFLYSTDFILSYFGGLLLSTLLYYCVALSVISISWLSKKLSQRLNHMKLSE